MCAQDCVECWGDGCERDESCIRGCASRNDEGDRCGSWSPGDYGVALAWGCSGEDDGGFGAVHGQCGDEKIAECSCLWDHYSCSGDVCEEPTPWMPPVDDDDDDDDDGTNDTGETSTGDTSTGDTGGSGTGDGEEPVEPDVALAWTRQWGTAVAEDVADVALASDGSIYVVGSTRGKLGAANENAGGWDAVLVRYDAAGSWQWSRQWGSTGHDRATALLIDAAGTVFVAGVAGGSIDGATTFGQDDVFLSRFGPDGSRTDLATWGSAALDHAHALTLAGDESVRVVGVTTGRFDRVGGDDAEVFATTFAADGSVLDVMMWGSGEDEVDARAVVDPTSGTLFVTGSTMGDLGGSNAGQADVFALAHVPGSGDQWIRQWGGAQYDRGQALALVGDTALYVAGTGGGDMFVVAYDLLGGLLGVRWWGSSGLDAAHDVVASSDGRVYVVGTTRGQLGSLDPNVGQGDVFVTAFEDLTLLWHHQFGTAARDVALAATSGPDGSLVLAGHTLGDLGGPNAGESDGFLTKLIRVEEDSP